MCEYERPIFNYEIEEKEKCSDCKYHHWYYDEGKKYGCPSIGRRICGSFREWKGEATMDGWATQWRSLPPAYKGGESND